MDHDVSLSAFESYLEGVSAPSTAKKYSSYTETFLRLMETNGYQRFSELPQGFLSEYVALLSNQGHAGATIRVYIFAAKKYLNWVAGKGIEVTVFAKPGLPKRNLSLKASLPQDRISDFFHQADLVLEEPVRSAAMLLPCSGLRASEMVSLRLENIERMTLQMKKSKDPKAEKSTLFFRVRGKGGKWRDAPLMEEGVEILTGYLAGFRKRNPRGKWLFPRVTEVTKGKNHISDVHLRNALREIRDGLGLVGEFTPHTMRRTYITTLYNRGVDLGVLARIAGHANVQTTLDHYINMDPETTIRKVVEAGSLTRK